jgi:hypothetical protein
MLHLIVITDFFTDFFYKCSNTAVKQSVHGLFQSQAPRPVFAFLKARQPFLICQHFSPLAATSRQPSHRTLLESVSFSPVVSTVLLELLFYRHRL